MDIRRATEADEPAVLDIARRSLGWSDDPRFVDLYRWKHDHNPFGPSPRWVAVEDGEVIGFRAFLRWRFRRGDETADAVRAVDTATDPAHQGRGVFRALTMRAVEELTDEGVQFVFNTPNDQSRPGYLKMGWRELGRPSVGVLPRARSALTILRARTPAERWSEPNQVGVPAPDALAEWSRRMTSSGRHRAAPDRSRWRTDATSDFLRWRYCLPSLHYRAIPTAGGLDVGLAVFRVRRRGPAIEATVVDVLGATSGAPVHPADRRRALRRILRDTGADYLLVATDRRIDPTPLVAVPGLGPLVTIRPLAGPPPASPAEMSFALGDLELF